MFFKLAVFGEDDLKKIHELLAQLEGEWVEGKDSATGYAKEVKNNKQIVLGNKKAQVLFDSIRVHLLGHQAIKHLAFPRHVANIMFNRYTPGESYGWHVDNARMFHYRTDLSFTIFLNDPSEYEGGELQIKAETGQISSVKLKPGEMVLYSTGAIHQVTPVTKGVRTCCVGWFESFIREDSDRALCFKMLKAFSEIKEKYSIPGDEMTVFNEIQNRVVRRLAE
jgi:PKHD-type hydroxylase